MSLKFQCLALNALAWLSSCWAYRTMRWILSLCDNSPTFNQQQALFIGLAALTLPHLIVVEEIRLTGCVGGRATS